MSCSCQWYRVCDAGALRAEPLATLMSCAVKRKKAEPGWATASKNLPSREIPLWWRRAVLPSLLLDK